MYKVRFKNSVKKDLKKIGKSNLKENFEGIVKVLKENPYQESQLFEKLLPKSEGRYSRRLNRQHRVVYRVDEVNKVVIIFSLVTL